MAEASPTPDVDVEVFLNAGSEVTFDIICFPCNDDGQIQEAEGFCADCCEHLCSACLKYHRKFSATKHHKIIDKEDMPGKPSISSASDICTERCHNHTDEIIKYFCPTHKVLGCSVCVTLNHTLCKDVTYIPEAAANLSDSQEFKDFQAKMETLIKKSEYIIKNTESNIKLSTEYRAKALQEIETYRQEINDALDKLKYELEQQSEEIEAREATRMNAVTDTSNHLLVELQRMSIDIKELLEKKQHCKLFMDMKNAEDKLEDIQDKFPKDEGLFVTAVRFQPNLELRRLVQKSDAFGNILVKSPLEINANYMTAVNVISPRDTGTCRIKSIALLPANKLVIADCGNKSVKLLDIESKLILSEYKTEHPLHDVAVVGKTTIAITFPGAKKIQFLKSGDELSFVEEIRFNAQCWNIACFVEKLVVSFSDPCEVRIVNMAGEVLQTFATTSQGDRLFSTAPRLAVSSFNQAIYASDWKKNRVTMLDIDGIVRAVYEDADLKKSRQVAVDDTGMVYLCGTDSKNIHLLTPDCRKVKILLSAQDDRITRPRVLCYCNVTQRLYVSTLNDENVKVFQMS